MSARREVTSMTLPEYYENDILFFFDGKPVALSLYQMLYRHIASAFPGASVKVQKTQISFYDKHLFLAVSLPRRKREGGILATIGLPYRLESPRVAVAVEPYPNRWTTHIPVTEEEQIDGELLGWIREAHNFALYK